jgi:Esterase/lipase
MKGLLPAIMAGTMTFSFSTASVLKQIIPQPARQAASGVSAPAKPMAKAKKQADSGTGTASKKKYADVVYSTLDKDYQQMDIYLPDKGDGPYPVIVYIHGGGFRSSKDSNATVNAGILNAALDDQYAVASVNYRGSDQAKFPAAISDCKAAVRFLRANAGKYNLDAEKIAAWGTSAGGNLAAMLGTTAGVHILDGDDNENLEYSSAVQAVVDWFGPIDFLKEDGQFAKAGITPSGGKIDSDSSNASQYIGQLISRDPALTALAGPAHYIPEMDVKTAPGFSIEHGTADITVPVQQSKNFARKLRKTLGKDKVQLTLLDGAAHGTPQFFEKENIDRMMTFLNNTLRQPEKET